jgi:N-acetylmuramic acid 6-phosphate etherase
MSGSASSARERADQFLAIASDFHLGHLLTETSHPRTATLSDTARASAAAGLAALFDVDRDLLRTYGTWSAGEQPRRMADAVLDALRSGHNIFFTGCGATGRLSIQLDAAWRAFWQARRAEGRATPDPDRWECRTRSVMAGGDYALIKSVEGFEDFAPFGRRQIADLGLTAGDVVFAITEGGETSFVIGTAWQGVDAGARVFFVYNNPDDVLRAHVRRSREVIDDPRIEKVNITTGPMAITGSTRMQATSIELAVMLTVLEIVLRDLFAAEGVRLAGLGPSDAVTTEMRAALSDLHAEMTKTDLLDRLANLVEMEEVIYRASARTSYLASSFGIDVLTDTTERSPTFCTPSFRKWDDDQASESWAFLFTPVKDTDTAWRRLLCRDPQTIEWTDNDLGEMLDADAAARQAGVLREIGRRDLLRFRIGLDGRACRPIRPGDGLTAIVSDSDLSLVDAMPGAFSAALQDARSSGATTACIGVGRAEGLSRLQRSAGFASAMHTVLLPVPETPFLLEPVARVAIKLLMNALSTCTMVRLGRVIGNRMIWVVPSNLKLIDRATRYIRDLAGVSYEVACYALFEVIEFIEPRRSAGQAYPPPVGVATMRLRHGMSLVDAESRLARELT